jgi:hypothetical protein
MKSARQEQVVMKSNFGKNAICAQSNIWENVSKTQLLLNITVCSKNDRTVP